MIHCGICRSLIALALLTAVAAGFGGERLTTANNAESKEQREARMAWFREARLGMFIHWGVSSVPSGLWQGKKSNYADWYLERTKMPVSQYETFREQFNPTKFDARQWVAAAKDAGMKYIVVTSKHHDGFAMFETRMSDWGIMSTPYRRDPMKELARACQEAGLKFCFYYSIMDWHHPDYRPRRAWNDVAIARGEPDFDRYTAFVKGQLKELLTNYGPIGILWFDGAWEESWSKEHGRDICQYVRSLQPEIIINNRLNRDANQGKDESLGDYGTPEQEIPANGQPGTDWEACMTMNDHWGYNRFDQNWKSPTVLIRLLIDSASKGGNFLLNVGPTAEGVIPAPSLERLGEIGRWMRQNGEAIYGTAASPFAKAPTWGRVTAKPGKLYLLVFAWPENGRLVLGERTIKPIARAYLATDPRRTLSVRQKPEGVTITVPKIAPNEAASVVVLELFSNEQG